MSKAYQVMKDLAWHGVCWVAVSTTIWAIWWLIYHGIILLIVSLGGHPYV